MESLKGVSGRPRKYDAKILSIVDTEGSIFIKNNSHYVAMRRSANRLGVFPVRVFKCLYFRSVKTNSMDIIKTLM